MKRGKIYGWTRKPNLINGWAYIKGRNSSWSKGNFLEDIDLLRIVGTSGSIKSISKKLASNYLALAKAAKRDGITIIITSGFRTYKKQEYFYRRYKNGGNKAAKPGRSNHQNGIALDIANTKSGTSIVYQWLKENATKYGFVRTVKSESWHWVYLPGKAKILREKGDYRTWKI